MQIPLEITIHLEMVRGEILYKSGKALTDRNCQRVKRRKLI